MKIIKLNAIDSTNSYLINLSKKETLVDPTIVVAKEQFKGKGQMGASWQSNSSKSLTFSIYKRFDKLPIRNVFTINFAISNAIYFVLNKLLIPQLRIKWPNDIMSYSKKLAGILIENQIKQGYIVSSVIGVGLNVNEEVFENLPQATSIFLATGKKTNIDDIFYSLIDEIIKELNKVISIQTIILKSNYEKNLFKINTMSAFEDNNGSQFNGKIRGVTEIGELLIENEEQQLLSFQLKDIKYLL